MLTFYPIAYVSRMYIRTTDRLVTLFLQKIVMYQRSQANLRRSA